MKPEPTARQKEILDFIQEHVEFNGYPPTYREIGKRFGISSTFGVKRHIDALIKKGFLSSESNQSRTLSIISLNNKPSVASANFAQIPIVGRVAAGQPILAEENIEGNISIDMNIIRNKSGCFGLKVHGDSMVNAGIMEGDLVIVSPQKEAVNGDIVIALLGDEATMKRFFKTENKIILHPENESYTDIEVTNQENFNLVGKVIGVFRSYN